MKKLFVILALLPIVLFAQDSVSVATKEDVENVKGALDGLNESYLETKTTVDALKKIKISGYVQAQYQATDGIAGTAFNGSSAPAPGGFSGGAFPNDVSSRFSVRRGRIKFNYDNDLTQYVMQFDVTQGGLAIKDMYASIREPYLKLATFTGGIFDRPFGFEISYSSSMREAPERSRMYQTLFPGERELGAKIELAPQSGVLSMFNAKVGIFNGNNNNNNENDNNKDIIGRVGFQLPFNEENLAIDGGVSFYSGKVTDGSKFKYTIKSGAWSVDSTTTNNGKSFDRSYVGVDAQLYYDLPVLGGLSLRGEYITGTQPGTAAASTYYVYSKGSGTPLYSRNFSGYYINYIQNIGLTEQIVVKYDQYNPNTDIKSANIGTGNLTTVGDITYTTLGLGVVHHFDGNVKLTLYYEMISNDKVSSATTNAALLPYKLDVKDNVLTVRMQYKF
jgi:phosphate-selective porin